MHFQIAILYLSLIIFGVMFQYKLWKMEKLSAYSIFHASFFLYYGVVPFVLEVFNAIFMNMPGIFTGIIYSANINQKLFSFLIILVAYFIIVISYFIYNKGLLRKKRTDLDIDNEYSMRLVYKYGFFFFIIGGFSILFFFTELGGFRAALRFAEVLRYIGTDPSNYYGPLGAIFRMLSFLIMGAAYCFKTYSDKTNSRRGKLLFYISFLLSIMYLLFNSGRAPIIFFLVPFIIGPIIRKDKNIIKTLFIIFVGVIVTAELFDVFLYRISLGTISNIQTSSNFIGKINSALQDFSFPYANIINVNKMNELLGYRYGRDYFLWAINILPSRIFSIIGLSIPDFETINSNTTIFYFHYIPNLLGGVPTDLITLGMRQLNIPGLVFNCLLFSYFALYFDRISRKIGKDYNIVIFRIKLLFFTFIGNNDISAFVRGSLFIVILIIMLNRISRRKKKIKVLKNNLENEVCL